MKKVSLKTKDEYKKRISANIRKQRLKNEYSQKEAAELLEISPVFLSNLERGKRSPSLETLIELSYLFQCPLGAFFRGIENNEESKFIEITSDKNIQRCLILLAELEIPDIKRAEKILKMIFDKR